METIFIYLLKSSALLAIFYLVYYFLVQKETFFNSNRWFLLSGLFTSILLPLFFIKKIVFVEKPTYFPSNFTTKELNSTVINTVTPFDWNTLIFVSYSVLVLLFVLKIVSELVSLFKLIKNKEIHIVKPFALVDVNENINPFSFFKYIVFNSNRYSDVELENIISHEKVHSREKHSVDVLIARIFCAVFWFNPFVWLYKKAIIQNLEYIADRKAIQNIENKKAYQMTLLKVVSDQNYLPITNSFYQSLIKKRIVMLNKNQSKQRNIWKYALVLPALVAFIIFFQVKVIAQEKSSVSNYYKENLVHNNPIVITKNTSDNALKEITETVKKESDVEIKFKNVKRNNKEEITAISTYFKNKKGTKGNHIVVSDEPIKPFYIQIKKDRKGNMSISLINDKPIAFNKSEEDTDLDYSFQDSNEEGTDFPIPPTPPNAPDMSNMPTPPSPPNFLMHPNVKPPTDPNDEKGWQKFEAEMEKFSKNWENWENSTEMKEFESKMKIFESQMEKWQPDMTNFEKQMEKFELKMEAYQDKMRGYEERMRDKNEDRSESIRERMSERREEIEAKRETRKARMETEKSH